MEEWFQEFINENGRKPTRKEFGEAKEKGEFISQEFEKMDKNGEELTGAAQDWEQLFELEIGRKSTLEEFLLAQSTNFEESIANVIDKAREMKAPQSEAHPESELENNELIHLRSCPHCGTENAVDALYCKECYTNLQAPFEENQIEDNSGNKKEKKSLFLPLVIIFTVIFLAICGIVFAALEHNGEVARAKAISQSLSFKKSESKVSESESKKKASESESESKALKSDFESASIADSKEQASEDSAFSSETASYSQFESRSEAAASERESKAVVAAQSRAKASSSAVLATWGKMNDNQKIALIVQLAGLEVDGNQQFALQSGTITNGTIVDNNGDKLTIVTTASSISFNTGNGMQTESVRDAMAQYYNGTAQANTNAIASTQIVKKLASSTTTQKSSTTESTTMSN